MTFELTCFLCQFTTEYDKYVLDCYALTLFQHIPFLLTTSLGLPRSDQIQTDDTGYKVFHENQQQFVYNQRTWNNFNDQSFLKVTASNHTFILFRKICKLTSPTILNSWLRYALLSTDNGTVKQLQICPSKISMAPIPVA